ncbi:uncharacterized protein LOC135818968 [Sycon ciliatum]|uniref:uncharacterized protein LOC135818968 n=1 Tax=Sycon ciliatum TaxID=27933 RepID=UPI0020A9BD1B|eukprot:scpid71390/ scgid9805/ Exocyst complex component 2; Exocyst complex component Sec5
MSQAGEERLQPAEITVIVSSASGLPTGKSGRCRASVIFGVGKTKFRTQQIDNANPVWNERSIVPVSETDSSPLVFTVTRKERPLGEVSIPLAKVPLKCTKPTTITLAACRDCPSPTGQLSYECWVTKHYPGKSPSLLGASNNNLGDGMGNVGEIKRSKSMKNRVGSSLRSSLRRGSEGQKTLDPNGLRSAGKTSPTLASSAEDVTRQPARLQGEVAASSSVPCTPEVPKSLLSPNGTPVETRTPPKRRFSFVRSDDPKSAGTTSPQGMAKSQSSTAVPLKEAEPTPKVTGISPRDGSKVGGTVLTVRGENLGTSADDIEAVTVCGVPCNLEDLDYVSARKLVCKTPPGSVGSGPVEVQTKSQGKGSSTVTFTYWDPSVQPEERMPVLPDPEPVRTASLSPSTADGIADAAAKAVSGKKKKFGQSTSKTSIREDTHIAALEEKDEAIRQLSERVTQLEFENSRLNIYIEKIMARAMEKCPELLST